MLALRGAFTFLTRVPVPGADPADWHAFRRSPWTFPVVGTVVGAVAGLAFLAPSPWTATAGYLVALYLLTGVTHADGLADLGDAVAVHDPDRRLSVLKDADLGVGGALALGVTLLATTLGALALATGPAGDAGGGVVDGSTDGALVGSVAIVVVLAAEVGAKAGMALLACLGTPTHEGLGSAVVGEVGPRSLVAVAAVSVAVVSVPALLAVPSGVLPAVAAALLAGPAVSLLLLVRVRPWLGGVSGDVFGAANELGRAVALHAGVIAWAIA
ncbi:adenosylcobinamide-GDP ribazoletransferase [Halorubrum sp. 48-1-W]|uniref:adenosylcobinamide-GDP ribazoletransferase n=1 Tax=Halorubrum sp. 48-1-W TaxID=2249761 RepID=UPI000DCD4761|nr:adenosylcobinamide-GDP ribazoletransferase [Halorubrum sp. 48-1-W]RAW44991.1 adenosylcobinamide-GDP ribazoletransferase [Halorubrum sp. 48-1-W]